MNIKQLFIFFLLFFGLFVKHTHSSLAQTIFSDNFEDGSIFDTWTHFSGNWVLENYNSSTWATIHSGSSTDNEIQIGDTSLFDYEFKVDIHKIEGEDLNLFFRIQPLRFTGLQGHNLPVGYGLHMKHGRFVLQKFTTSQGIEIPDTIVVESFLNNTTKNVRISLKQNNIKVFTENSDTPIINYTDSDSPFLNGGIALASITGSAGTDFQFDNVVVSELPVATQSPSPTPSPTAPPSPTPSPSPTPTISPLPNPTYVSLNVPNLKQYSLPWKNKLYDHLNATIEQFGCALTSATMVLQYHGHNVTPDTLNEWLKNQPDGFIRNGLVNWLAISRYTKINESLSASTLEYKRYEPTKENLDNEINENRPAILREPGHFVVAKSILPSTYGINDPGYSDRNDLNSYGNSFQSIGSFIPSHTDLSYMMFVIDPHVDISLFDSFGGQVNYQKFIEDPINGLQNQNKKSGKPLKMLIFPKPQNGKYSLTVSGSGSYDLETYLYDTKGKVTKQSFKNNVKQNNIDTYQISFESKKNVKDVVNEHIEDFLKKCKNGLKDLKYFFNFK